MNNQQYEEQVNHPARYNKGDIECIDAIKAATCNLTGIDAVCTANAIKYLWRWKEKNGLEDLEKAMWYIRRLKQEHEHEVRAQDVLSSKKDGLDFRQSKDTNWVCYNPEETITGAWNQFSGQDFTNSETIQS